MILISSGAFRRPSELIDSCRQGPSVSVMKYMRSNMLGNSVTRVEEAGGGNWKMVPTGDFSLVGV